MTETYELEKIIAELYSLEETLGLTPPSVINRDLLQFKVHNLVSRLRIWKENNYDKLRDALDRWNKARKLMDGEISERDEIVGKWY
jgi:hypothetical protein